jgi:hypothetical protein
MREGPKGSEGYQFSQDELDYLATHYADVLKWVAPQRWLMTSLAFALLLGLVAHIAGWATSSGAGEADDLIALVGDLLANLGIALWTSAIIVVFLEVLPAAARRRAHAYASYAAVALAARGVAVEPPAAEEDEPGA